MFAKSKIEGETVIIFTSAALAAIFILLFLLLSLIAYNGLTTFWPRPIIYLLQKNGQTIVGELIDREKDHEGNTRIQIFKGNREITGEDHVWVKESEISGINMPTEAVLVERTTWGNAYGMLEQSNLMMPNFTKVIGCSYSRENHANDNKDSNQSLSLTLDGTSTDIPAESIIQIICPNTLSYFAKLKLYLTRLKTFITSNPREANTEGGVFPALYGTVLLVFLMSIIVTPLGVITAIYLHEYAKPGIFVTTVRIAVNNLAGIPSIVFGVFGLGFLIYGVGGTIDKIFFSDTLPSPTFGTGGLLWASITLALLTLPTVIVTAEEGLRSIPKQWREASYALGATKSETTLQVVLPALVPSIITGAILAISRAAGEVAPLMITGVIKLAHKLPFDLEAPYLHLERKFMHLGFHIFDLGFQSPNVDSARPMVYTTTLLLLLIVFSLNSTASFIRLKMRRRLVTSNF